MDSAVSQPNLGPSNKSASRIREMLESVRGRMAAVVGQSSIGSMLPDNHNQITTSASKIPTKSGQVATRSPSVANNGQKIKLRALMTELAASKPNKLYGLNKSGNGGGGGLTNQTDDKDLQMNLLRTLDDIQCVIEFLRDKLKNDFETTKEQLADYFSGDSNAQLSSLAHDCLCNILTFGKHLKESTAPVTTTTANNDKENKYKTHLDTIRDKCTLKRASSISSRLTSKAAIRRVVGDRRSIGGNLINLAAPAKTTNTNQLQPIHDDHEANRASFGGYIPSERRQSSLVYRNPQQQYSSANLAPSRSMASSKLVRTSSTCSSMIKSSLSSLSSQATTGANTSSSANTSDHDDLHDGLMRLLNETNSRRNSDKMRISMGSIRRFSGRLIDLSD